MTLNFESLIANFWLAVAILAALLFFVLWLGDMFRAGIWKQRAMKIALERDDFAAKYFALREQQVSEIRLRARLQEARETRLAKNLRHVLNQNEPSNKYPYPDDGPWPIRQPVPGSSKSKKPSGESDE